MAGPDDTVRTFFEAMEARDWDGAGRLLSPSVGIRYTETGERFVGADFLAMNRAYPEGWTLTVVECVSQDDRVAAQVRVDQGDDVFWCAGFYTVVDHKIIEGTEHWVREGSDTPPEWRRRYSTP